MPPKANPKKLNALQLKTLTLVQELARTSGGVEPDPETGNIRIGAPPRIHGNHFHIGASVVMTADATGLDNRGVWMALVRKGLVIPGAHGFELTPDGQAYDTGLRDTILHGSDH